MTSTAGPTVSDVPPARPDLHASEVVLSVDGLVKRYGGHVAVDGLSFGVRRGEIFGFLGPNGAGKSTTLEIVEGLRSPDAGAVAVFGLPLAEHLARSRARVGVQLQGTALPQRLTAREVLDLFAALYGRADAAAVDRLVETFGIGEFQRTIVRKLSGGQLQRVALALAFVNAPDLLILDEPSAGLDPAARNRLWESLRAARAGGVTIVVATHDMVEAERLCDRVAIVDRGRVIACGAPAELARELFTEVAIRVTLDGGGSLSAEAAGLDSVTRVVRSAERTVLYSTDAPRSLAGLLGLGEAAGVRFAAIEIRPATLEDVFLKLTGRELA